ncbi:MAG: TIGR01620 family protein, partial [Proteobacteria bacterium]|nr:TIGR01620 family protein [Pseudomonadota bacterium]
EASRGPRVFAPDDRAARIEDSEDVFAGIEAQLPPPAPPSRLSMFSTLVWSAFIGLVTLWAFDAAWNWVVSLSQRTPWLGQVALGLIGILVLGLLVFLLREALAMARLKKASALRERAEKLLVAPQTEAARGFAKDLASFYARDPASSAGRAEIERLLGEVHDGATVMAASERALLAPKDNAARALIARSAERVSVVTALSPRALVDVIFVLVQSVVLIRQLSTLYGGRATGLGLMRLSARVFGYLAVTGSVAMADQMASQMLGAGLAAKLSARLGEGVLNGVLCARVGIAAIDLIRPMPYRESGPIYISEVVKNTFTQSRVAENTAP